MTETYLPTELEFSAFKNNIEQEKFRILSVPATNNSYEVGYYFTACRLTVSVWPNLLFDASPAEQINSGRILISEGADIKYFSSPIMWTEDYFQKLLILSKISKERAEKRPICKKCGCYLNIMPGLHPGSVYWKCIVQHNERSGWDDNLSTDSQKIVIVERKMRKHTHVQFNKTSFHDFQRKVSCIFLQPTSPR